MKLFVDTGSIKEIEAVAALGIIDGVTTNPSLLAKETGDFRANLKKICEIVKGPVSGEVTATDFAGMMHAGARHREDRRAHGGQGAADARRRQSLQDAVGRRHPRQRDAVFSAAQALLAAKAGATFVSPFVGRLDDIATSGMELIRDIVEIYRNYDFKAEVLVASCRHPMHIVEAARIGADICTCPPSVIDALFNHPLTSSGLEKFLKDWEKSQAVKA